MAKSSVFWLAALASPAVSEWITRTLRPTGTAAPLMRRQEAPHDCTFFEAAYSAQDTCEDFASRWGITTDDFISWNPSVGADCSGIKIDQEYCVERNWGIPVVTSTTTKSESPAPTSANTVPSPVQEGIIKTCTAYYKAVSGDTCATIVQKYGTFDLAQFISWNPAVGSGCTSLWAQTHYCVGIPGTPTAPPTSTKATSTSTGVPKPTETQQGLIDSCVRFYKTVKDDTCAGIVRMYGTFTLAEFVSWNPAIGNDCRGLWAETYYCVGIPGTATRILTTTTTSRTTTSTTQGNGISTPTSIQPGLVKDCDKFYWVNSGESCQTIAAKNGITTGQLNAWNPSIGSDCSGLWANSNVCVGVIGYVYPESATCYSTEKTWGDNKPAALESVPKWCNGDSNTDGSGGFATSQLKRGCYNAPYGTNKIEFWIRNDFGVGQYLTEAKCNQITKIAINRCERGGTGTYESWYFRASVSAGRC